MKSRTKKWLAVSGCLIVCAVLVVLIAGRFTKALSDDVALPTPTPSEVVVPTPTVPVESIPVEETPDSSTGIPAPSPAPTHSAGAGGAAQTIQPDPVKPSPGKEVLENPSQKPDGTLVTESPKPVEHEKVPTPPPPAPSTPSGGGGLPGFDNVPDMGPNQGGRLDDMYESGEKIGEMG